MGMDMLLVVVPVDHDKAEAEANLAELTDEELTSIFEEYHGCTLEEWGEPLPIRKVFAEALDAAYGYRRDVTQLILDDRSWVVTGGLSGGDTPTDAYDLLALLAETPITWTYWKLADYPAAEA